MKARLKLFFLNSGTVFFLFFLFLAIGCEKKIDPNRPVAVFKKNGQKESVTVTELIQAIQRSKQKYRPEKLKNPDDFLIIKEKTVQELIQKKILYLEAIQQGFSVSDSELEEEIRRYKSRYTEKSFQELLQQQGIDYKSWQETKKENLLIHHFLKERVFASIEIPTEKIKDYYDRNLTEFTHPESVRVRQILTDTKEKAEKILAQAKKDENFARLAHDFSLSPDRVKGGEIDPIEKEHFPKEFEICFNLKVGEISPVVQSVYGFHIFKILEKKPSEQIPFSEVKDKIKESFLEQERLKKFEKYYQNLQQQYPVEISWNLLKRVQL